MDALIKEVNKLIDDSTLVRDEVDKLSVSLSLVADSFMSTGKAMVPVVPPAARCEKAMANFISPLVQKQKQLKLLSSKGRAKEIMEEYQAAYREWHEAVVKLNRMNVKEDPRLKKRIELHQVKIKGLKETLDGIEADCKDELELIKEDQEALIRTNVVILLEMQKKVFDQCSGALDTFRKEWNTGKRFI